MKLVIDTSDKSNAKINCDTLNAYELGVCIGKYLDFISEEAGAYAPEVKLNALRDITAGIYISATVNVIKEED